MSGPAERAALDRVPDLPQWVDTRGMLLTGRAVVSFPANPDLASDGFVVELASRGLLSAVDNPPAALVAERARAMAGHVNLLCPPETAAAVAAALSGWTRHPVRLHALPGVMPWEAEPDLAVSIRTRVDAPSLAHVPDLLRHELIETLEGRPSARFVPGDLPAPQPEDVAGGAIPMAFVIVDDRAVAFCYPVIQTETLWDLSVDTLATARGRGFAGRAARAMIRHLRGHGKAPVWGALEANAASLSVARQLGFVPAGQLAVFTPG